jgi:hypothetical protein
MIIKDNFFTEAQMEQLKQLIHQDIQQHGGKFERYEDEQDHHQTDDCALYYLNHETKNLYFKLMVEKGIFTPQVLEPNEFDHTLRYHEMKYPYVSTWHKDRMSDWHSDEIDYVGISYFLNDTWNYADGGLFLYKQDNADQGQYVEPIGNRIIINDEDLYHAVTQITNPTVKRASLQLFIHTKYLI